MQQQGHKYFARRPPLTSRWIKRSKFDFFRTISCCILGNYKCSNIILPADLPPDHGVKGSKFYFSEHGQVTYQIKGIRNAATL